MRPMKLLLAFTLICSVFLFSCSVRDGGDDDSDSGKDVLYQISTLSALLEGNYDGLVTFDTVLEQGDFGLGTFDALDGELIVLDGEAYRVPAGGVPTEVDDSVTTPFAVVTPWEPDTVIAFEAPLSCAELQASIDAELDSVEAPYAIKVAGDYRTMKTRSVERQDAPYAKLVDALEDQIIFELQDVTATMVGFRLPEYMAGSNAAGYHFHALTDDLAAGGHVLDCEATSVVVEIDDIDAWRVDLP